MNRAARLVIWVVVVLVALAILWFFVFPWAEGLLDSGGTIG